MQQSGPAPDAFWIVNAAGRIVFESKVLLEISQPDRDPDFLANLSRIDPAINALEFYPVAGGYVFLLFLRGRDAGGAEIDRKLALTLAHDLRSPLATLYY